MMFLLISFVGSVEVMWSSMRLCVCFVKIDFCLQGCRMIWIWRDTINLIGGDHFKSDHTWMNSVLVNFHDVGAGIKVFMDFSFNFTEKVILKKLLLIFLMILTGCFVWLMIICDTQPTMGHNHLRNNDGMNLSALKTFTSKEIYKGNAFEPSKQPYHIRCDHQGNPSIISEMWTEYPHELNGLIHLSSWASMASDSRRALITT